MEFFGSMEFFGFLAFCMAGGLYAKVHRLERILRENGIGSVRAEGVGDQLRRQVGKTVVLALENDLWETRYKVLDTDETWALVLINEGKKNEREMLIRLDSVKQIKVK